MLQTTSFDIHLCTTSVLFGSCPSDPLVYEIYLQKEIDATTELAQAERDALPEMSEDEEKVTVFLRIGEKPALFGHVIKGFCKSACGAMWAVNKSHSAELRAYKKRIDTLIHIKPYIFPLAVPEGPIEYLNTYMKHGFPVCVRPLRAETAKGPRVALARSEVVPPGTEMDFKLVVIGEVPALARQATKKFPIHEELLREWFDLGEYHGLGSWRNAGWGQFTYEMKRST